MQGSKVILGGYGCGYSVGSSSQTISVVQSIQKVVSGTSIFYSGVAISNSNTSRNSGVRYTVHLWLIFGVLVVHVELRGIWRPIWLKRLRAVMRIPGAGFGRASLGLGRRLKQSLSGIAGHTRSC